MATVALLQQNNQMTYSQPLSGQPPSNVGHNKKPIKVLSILMGIELTCLTLLAASKYYLGDMGMGGIIFVLPLGFLLCTLLGLLIVVPVFSIIALRKKQATTKSEHVIVWTSLLLNVAAIVIVATEVAITVMTTMI